MDGGITFSSGWWVSIDFLRDTHPSIATLAGQAHLSIEQTAFELDRWASGIGLPYGVTVDRDNCTYECAT